MAKDLDDCTSGADLGRRRERRPRVGFGRKRLRLNAANAFDVPSSLFFLHADPPLFNKEREVGVEKTQSSSCGGGGEDVSHGRGGRCDEDGRGKGNGNSSG